MAYENNGFGTYNDVEACNGEIYENEVHINYIYDNEVHINDIYENEVHINDIYENANGTVNHQIPTTSVIVQPPKYEDVYKPPFYISIAPPPPQYFQNFQPQPSRSFQQNFGAEVDGFRYEKLHLVHRVLTLVFGGIIMVLDILLPPIFQYYYSIFPAGLFMVISGICSIHGNKKRNKSSLKASLTFNILALISLFIGYVMGVIAAGYPQIGLLQCTSRECMPIMEFYLITAGVRGFAVFNTIFGISLFVLVLLDSTLKCGTLCCNKKPLLQINYSQNQ